MKKTIRIFAAFLAITGLQSCGIITKTHYGNGLKLNLDFTSGKVNYKPQNKIPKPHLRAQNKLNYQSLKTISLDKLNPIILVKPKTNSKTKSSYFNQASQILKPSIPILKFSNKTLDTKSQEPSIVKKKVEPHVKIGGILFYASILGIILMGFINFPILASFLGLSLLAGIVLTLIGKRFMKKNPEKFRGNGLMWSVLITCSLFLLLTLINLAFFIVAFA